MKLATKASRIAAKAHRILGTTLCLLMASWFISGAVMLFSGYPYASAEERLAAVLPLQEADLRPLPAGAFAEMVAEGQVLRMFRGPDGLVVIGPDGYVTTDGTPVSKSSQERCLEVLQQANPAIHTRFKEVISEVGQWTVPEQVRSRLPLYLYEDEEGERHYLDPHSCVLAQHSTRSERFWAYLGAIPHWLYVAPLRMYRETWRWLIIGLSVLGLVLCVTGLYRGVTALRWARSGERRWPTSPIRRPTLRLHHLTGLAFGLLTFTWLLSGAMSLSPFDLSPTQPAAHVARERWMLGDGLSAVQLTPLGAFRACRGELEDVGLLELTALAGVPHYLCHDKKGETRLVDASLPSTPNESATPQARFSQRVLEAAAAYVLPGLLAGAGLMAEPDAYYYPDHSAPSFFERPYFRARYRDEAATTLYASPTTGSVLRHYTTSRRAERWLYHGLHSLDFPWLYRYGLLWYATILALLLAGTALSISAVVLSKRKFTGSLARRKGQSSASKASRA